MPTEIHGRMAERLAPATEAAAFFVASECLANAAKHSGATGVVITVGTVDDRVVLRVADNGHGGAAVVDGHGLHGLRDRVEAVDGSLDVESGGSGTTVTVRLPSCA